MMLSKHSIVWFLGFVCCSQSTTEGFTPTSPHVSVLSHFFVCGHQRAADSSPVISPFLHENTILQIYFICFHQLLGTMLSQHAANLIDPYVRGRLLLLLCKEIKRACRRARAQCAPTCRISWWACYAWNSSSCCNWNSWKALFFPCRWDISDPVWQQAQPSNYHCAFLFSCTSASARQQTLSSTQQCEHDCSHSAQHPNAPNDSSRWTN